MADLGLDTDFSVHLNDRNDLAYVTGREAFEQEVVVSLTEYLYYEALGTVDFETAKKAIRLQVSRVARKYDELESIVDIKIERSPDDAGTVIVTVNYQTAADFSFPAEL